MGGRKGTREAGGGAGARRIKVGWQRGRRWRCRGRVGRGVAGLAGEWQGWQGRGRGHLGEEQVPVGRVTDSSASSRRGEAGTSHPSEFNSVTRGLCVTWCLSRPRGQTRGLCVVGSAVDPAIRRQDAGSGETGRVVRWELPHPVQEGGLCQGEGEGVGGRVGGVGGVWAGSEEAGRLVRRQLPHSQRESTTSG